MLKMDMLKFGKISTGLAAAASLAFAGVAPAQAGQEIRNDLSRCNTATPSVLININGIESSNGNIRVQIYNATKQDWMAKGRWIKRIQLAATQGTMKVCIPMDAAGTYGVAVRHDVNGNGKTDISKDGGGMSNNPSINIFNLGKPSYKKVGFTVGSSVKTISIKMKYM